MPLYGLTRKHPLHFIKGKSKAWNMLYSRDDLLLVDLLNIRQTP